MAVVVQEVKLVRRRGGSQAGRFQPFQARAGAAARQTRVVGWWCVDRNGSPGTVRQWRLPSQPGAHDWRGASRRGDAQAAARPGLGSRLPSGGCIEPLRPRPGPQTCVRSRCPGAGQLGLRAARPRRIARWPAARPAWGWGLLGTTRRWLSRFLGGAQPSQASSASNSRTIPTSHKLTNTLTALDYLSTPIYCPRSALN